MNWGNRTQLELGNYPAINDWKVFRQTERQARLMGLISLEDAAWLWALCGATWPAPRNHDDEVMALGNMQHIGWDPAKPGSDRTQYGGIPGERIERLRREIRRLTMDELIRQIKRNGIRIPGATPHFRPWDLGTGYMKADWNPSEESDATNDPEKEKPE
jgi:hypothetical protein